MTTKPPTNIELYQLIHDLSIRVASLEKQNKQLQQNAGGLKPNSLEWLNSGILPPPTITFDVFLQNGMQKIQGHLNTVFSINLIEGITAVLKDTISDQPNKESLPIRGVPSNSSIFYVYKQMNDQPTCWYLMNNDELNNMFETMRKQFIADFRDHWVTSNQENIKYNESIQKQYYANFIQIMGGKNAINSDMRHDRLCKNLFQLLK